jgi:hypothetical protein
MRSLVPIALLGSFVLVTAQAQSLAEHAAAASGATIGTAAGKPLSNAITKIFGQTDTAAKKAATAPSVTKPTAKPEPESAPLVQAVPQSGGGGGSLPAMGGGSAPSRHGGFTPHRAEAELASINPPEPVPSYQEPPRKEPTAEDFDTIQVGASEEQVVAALGQPESKITIPDDGHLVQICQYWSNGKQIGTVRLDNGQVVTIESRFHN